MSTSNMQVGVQAGPPAPSRPETVKRCSECFAELFVADRGYGSTALACPTHDFNRQILEVPAWIESEAKARPDLTRRYVDWLLAPEGSDPQ